MNYSIQQPDLFNITDRKKNKIYFGPDQVWYSDKWRVRAGCGPVSASIITAYLAFTRPNYRSLYSPETMDRDAFLQHMNDLFEFVRPGMMGVNRIPMYTEGVTSYAASKGIILTPHVFEAQGVHIGQREPSRVLADFVAGGLSSDCPLGFMALSRGREDRLQNWHWITITSAEITDEDVRVQASDEGRKITFDLQLWYMTTGLPGGLVYFG
ncbi:MAG: hypothetical protein AB9907_15510 [Flexilinea sp.]